MLGAMGAVGGLLTAKLLPELALAQSPVPVPDVETTDSTFASSRILQGDELASFIESVRQTEMFNPLWSYLLSQSFEPNTSQAVAIESRLAKNYGYMPNSFQHDTQQEFTQSNSTRRETLSEILSHISEAGGVIEIALAIPFRNESTRETAMLEFRSRPSSSVQSISVISIVSDADPEVINVLGSESGAIKILSRWAKQQDGHYMVTSNDGASFQFRLPKTIGRAGYGYGTQQVTCQTVCELATNFVCTSVLSFVPVKVCATCASVIETGPGVFVCVAACWISISVLTTIVCQAVNYWACREVCKNV
jgi:hypothetical protein